MFWHNLKYEVLSGLRVKEVLFWLILFPIVLGTLFKVAFSNIYQEYTLFSTVPVAVVETTQQPMLHTVLDSLESNEEPLFSVTYTDEETALSLLEKKEIDGILYAGDTLSLSVAGNGVEQTIIKSFAEQYHLQETIIRQTIQTAPEKTEAVIAALNNTIVGNQKISMTTGNTDYTTNYFYNLLAMVAMFGSITGLHIAIAQQGNLSPLGARKCCSPTPKSISLIAGLIGSYILQSICMVITVTYLVVVLKINFVGSLPLIYLSAIVSGILGVSLGFMVGSFGRLQENAKTGIAMTVSMLSCFCSGLMASNIRPYLAEHVPFFHSINPASLISDLFYCLNLYSDYQQYFYKLATILVMAVVFTAIGFLLTRRRKYASL
ncbi:MAG: ABC transporter permease [Oscillospiraceae bacterium]|nr:ABC transporter permease [Oscillospiraceae bacterium]